MTGPTTIILPQTIYQEIIDHALEGAPEEVCGILGGVGNRATELVRGRNEAEDRTGNYWVDGQTLYKQVEFEDRGEQMIAIYHSHPASEAYPSATDARSITYPDACHLICSLENPDQPVVRAFRFIVQDLAERPSDLQPVRDDTRFLARQHRSGRDGRYDLALIDRHGHERRRSVLIVELTIVLAP